MDMACRCPRPATGAGIGSGGSVLRKSLHNICLLAAFRAAAILAAWGLLYLLVGIAWWPAAQIGVSVTLTAWWRMRRDVAALADLAHAAVDLYGSSPARSAWPVSATNSPRSSARASRPACAKAADGSWRRVSTVLTDAAGPDGHGVARSSAMGPLSEAGAGIRRLHGVVQVTVHDWRREGPGGNKGV
ncbi:hypothetical protein [Winogradskya consettensis]|uniref:Uncharacterized protein n=1 Tax=Winogradskya consettensis TaxID=113560 RepID=A0A919SZH3_9ACTN|nr:hypothetical protein [Actinoplanes consettensis]GIM82196.1 hypothetical protein Aco04nite_80370 [Actinoplanes consettensis]